MGLCFIEAAMRRRSRGIYFRTIWGWLLCGVAVLVWFFGSDERRHGDDDETAERRRKVNNISRIVAGVLFILAIVVDTVVSNL